MQENEYAKYFSLKKTIFFVLALHGIVLLSFFKSFPKKTLFQEEKKPLIVQTINILPPKQIVVQQKKNLSTKNITPTKVNKVITKREAPIPRAPVKKTKEMQALRFALNNLEKKFEKIEKKKDVAVPLEKLPIPQNIKVLQIDTIDTKMPKTSSIKSTYQQKLISELQRSLDLPEYGMVKVKLSIAKDGKVENVQILEAFSEKNQNYLKKTLPDLFFPWLNQVAINDERLDFTITFKNQ